jgi:hypothetical protein
MILERLNYTDRETRFRRVIMSVYSLVWRVWGNSRGESTLGWIDARTVTLLQGKEKIMKY